MEKNTIVFMKNLTMTLSVVGIVSVLVFLTQGWTVDEKLEPRQTGLVQFISSVPNSIAEVDKKRINENTPSKELVDPGIHEFAIWKEGYQEWWKKANVKVGTILWLNYARLVPKNKVEKQFLDIPNIRSAKVSPDRKRIFVITEDSESKEAKFWLINIADSEPKISQLNFNPDLFARTFTNEEVANKNNLYKIADNLSISKIANDNRHIILNFKNGEKSQWLSLNFEEVSDSINISQKFGVDFSEVIISSDDAIKLYGLTGADLHEINTSNNTLSATLLTNVVKFEVFDKDNIAFVQHDANTNKYLVGLMKGDKKITVDKDLDINPKISIGRYYNDSYIYVSTNKEIKIYKSHNWLEKMNLFKTLNLEFEPNLLKLNGESRILVAMNGKNIFSYDLETRDHSIFNLNTLEKPSWIDDFILADFEEGRLTMRDFDNNNKQVLSKAEYNMPFSLSSNQKYIYTFVKNNSGNYSLNQLKMTTE